MADSAAADITPREAPPGERSALRVILVSMPFMDARRPSIQIGLLKSLASASGFPARTLHANLDFAARIGSEYYDLLCDHRGPMVGDWLFSLEAFPGIAPDPDAYMLQDLADQVSYLGGSRQEVTKRLLQIRNIDVPGYLDSLVDSYPWDEAEVVGFSSTFQQNAASFALAQAAETALPGYFDGLRRC